MSPLSFNSLPRFDDFFLLLPKNDDPARSKDQFNRIFSSAGMRSFGAKKIKFHGPLTIIGTRRSKVLRASSPANVHSLPEFNDGSESLHI